MSLMPPATMPPEAPLDLPVQNLRHSPPRQTPGSDDPGARLWRLGVFAAAFGTTGALLWAFTDWFSDGGMRWVETTITFLIGLSFFWIALSVATATAGVLRGLGHHRPRMGDAAPLRVALLVPIHNEDTTTVLANVAAMARDLAQHGGGHAYDLFILSDSTDPNVVEREARAFDLIRADAAPGGPAIWYRRRAENTDRKTGNIADWVRRWGGASDAMVVLDADSLMSGAAIRTLADALAADPETGLIQTCPRLIGARTLWARVQQFSAGVYGGVLAEGLASWSGTEGNYWGHNAILRTRAFAASAGLPRIGRKSRLIMSHDFVEAGLMRRAGWRVRFLPELSGSWEEAPATIVDHALRDRRWCQGNLQHLRLLTARGLHPVSRFHLFQGAMSYLTSPAWFCLLVIWALIGNGAEDSLITYFTEDNPTMPMWPQLSAISSLMLLIFMYLMLLMPKVLGALRLAFAGTRALGGGRRFALSLVIEICASILFAPILMVQQVVAVLRVVTGLQSGWSPQARGRGVPLGWAALARFHALETVTGLALVSGMLAGVVTLWLAPIAVPLALAVPLSRLSGVDMAQSRWAAPHLATPEMLTPPEVRRQAEAEARRLSTALAVPAQVAAE